MTVLVTVPDPDQRRRRLASAIAALSDAIASGDAIPALVELDALVAICEAHGLPIEAARVRRWIEGRQEIA